MGTLLAYFGQRWDAPRMDDETKLRHVPTPVGEPCLTCSEAIADGDRGTFVTLIPAEGPPRKVAVHVECELLGVTGHTFGVCACAGYDTTSRSAALVLLSRINTARAADGAGPL